jgi:MFS family permease
VAGGPLGNRSFQLLSMGQLASTVGDLCYAVALPWFVLSSHGGPVELGTVLACYGVPRTVLIPVGGVLADRWGPRVVMLAADVARCLLVCALVVVAARHTASLVVLASIAALIGAGEGLFLPASFTIIPSIVEPEQLQTANSVSTALNQVGSLLGPVLGGLLVATAGPAPAFAVDAASFAISALALALLRTRPRPAGEAAEESAGSRTPRAYGSCCAPHGCCRSRWWSSSWRTSPPAAPSRSRCPRSRTPTTARPGTGR